MTKSKVLAGLSLAAGLAVAVTGVAIGQDAIAKRKEMMKSVGGATKAASQMVKGETPFDAAKAAAAMTTIATGWEPFAKLFPAGTEKGGETTASPKIWQDMKDFDAKGKKMASDAKTAADAAAKGPDAFKAAFGEMAKNCKGCHEVYRIPKK